MTMDRQLVVVALCIANVLQVSVAHSCSDRSRVKCMAVTAQSERNAQLASGGYSATGSAMCTPAGKKVYCLKEHSYHRCSAGEEPCCEDGSNPSHSGNNQGGSDNLQCSATEATMASESPVQIILDDMDLKAVSPMTNAFEGSYTPCMQDAYKGQFHHDWAKNKGSASYTFKVNVPVSGCYKLEEYHPGKTFACNRYLPRNARLDVKYCKGKSKTLFINQGVKAGQWNTIDSLKFYKGMEGELTMRSHADEKCTAGNCFWVVDAFRLTRTGDMCTGHDEPEPEPEPKQVKATQATPAGAVDSNGRDGTLLLEASWHGVGSVQVKLEEHKGVLATALAAHLGHKSAEVLGIWKMGRRLHTDHDHAGPEHFAVHFAAQEQVAGSPSQPNLQQALQDSFDQKSAGVHFHNAVASWGWSAVETKDSAKKDGAKEDESCFVTYVVIASVGAAALLGLGLLLCRRAMKRRANTGSPEKNVTPEEETRDLESSTEAKMEDCDEKDIAKEIDMEIASVSTGTPGSDGEGSEGSKTVTPTNSMLQEPLPQESEVVVSGQVVHEL